MIDHISVNVSDPAASKAFYEAALAPLGYRVVMEFGPVTGLGGPTPGAPEGAPVHADLWLTPAENPTPCHIAVAASSVRTSCLAGRLSTAYARPFHGSRDERSRSSRSRPWGRC